MTIRTRRTILTLALGAAAALGSAAWAVSGTSGPLAAPAGLNPCAAKTINPCAAKTLNPCAAKTLNPCAAKTLNPCAAEQLNPCSVEALNPCRAKRNPCVAANPCNPCGAKNPCNPCGGANPCNPCGGAPIDPARFKQPAGAKLVSGPASSLLARGTELWNDRSLSSVGLACSTCHFENYGQMMPSFAKPYPHNVTMPQQRAGVSEVSAAEMVQFCMLVPMQADALPWDSEDLAALTAYVENIRPGFKPVSNPCGAGTANPCGAKNPCNPCGGRRM